MSYGFDGTVGQTGADLLDLHLFTRPTLMTFAWWSWRSGDSSSGVGWRYFTDFGASTGSVQIGGTNGGGVEFFNAPHNAGANTGQWTWTQPTVQTVTHTAVTYDSTNLANDPVVYVNGAPVSTAESVTPAGTFDVEATTQRTLGNRGGQDRAFNGILQEFGQWNRLLTAGEVAGLAKGYTPAHYPVGLLDYAPLRRTLWSKRGLMTGVGTQIQAHFRTIDPRPPLTRAVKLTVGGPAPTRRSLTLLGVS